MFTKLLRTTSTLLSCVAGLAILGGCTSSESTPTRTAQSRYDSTAVASRSVTPLYPQQNRTMTNDGYRTLQPTNTNLQVSSNVPMQNNDNQTARSDDNGARFGLQSASEQQARVTVVSAKEPPLTRVETPSHTPNSDEFWVAGHWVANADGFSWNPGRVEHYRPGQLFMTGTWTPSPRGWEYSPEYWR